MKQEELSVYLDNNKNIEWFDDAENQQFCFRNTDLAWYQKDAHRATAIQYRMLDQMTEQDLHHAINKGLMVEGITRITGYFTKTSSWNPGKRGELEERKKYSL